MYRDNPEEGLVTSLLTCAAALATAALVCLVPFYYAASGTAHENVGLAAYKPPARAGLIPSDEHSGIALVRLQPAPVDAAVQAFAAKINRRAGRAERQRAERAAAERRRAAAVEQAVEHRRAARNRYWAMQPRGPMYQSPIF